jgi:pimeloyl-ACP methyl ester carboxylesterase
VLLLIHGLLGHMRGFDGLAPDLLGYGSQQETSSSITLAAQVAYLHSILGSEGIEEPIHLAGHSIGGAIAMLFANSYPSLVRSVISIEGNFTLRDAFWSKQIAESPLPEVERMLLADQHDPNAWLARSGVTPSAERTRAALSHLTNQPASTMHAMAKSVVETTGAAAYLSAVRSVLERGTPVHLIAGERSRDAWDVPGFVLGAAQSMSVIPNTGHLITIESPHAFQAILSHVCGRATN